MCRHNSLHPARFCQREAFGPGRVVAAFARELIIHLEGKKLILVPRHCLGARDMEPLFALVAHDTRMIVAQRLTAVAIFCLGVPRAFLIN